MRSAIDVLTRQLKNVFMDASTKNLVKAAMNEKQDTTKRCKKTNASHFKQDSK